MLERTSVVINDKEIEVRIEVGMPPEDVRFLEKSAHTLINGLPKIVDQAIMYQNIDQQALQHQVTLKLDQTYIRNQLEQQHLVAFVANNAILPRKAVYPMSQ